MSKSEDYETLLFRQVRFKDIYPVSRCILAVDHCYTAAKPNSI